MSMTNYPVTISGYGFSNGIVAEIPEEKEFSDIVADLQEAKQQICKCIEGDYNPDLLMDYVRTVYALDSYNATRYCDSSKKGTKYEVTVEIGKELNIPDNYFLFASSVYRNSELLVLRLSIFNDDVDVDLTKDHGIYTGIIDDPISYTMTDYFCTV